MPIHSCILGCPTCGTQLTYSGKDEAAPTICSRCGYAEPAGSGEIVSLISRSLAAVMAQKGITKAVSEGGELDLSTALLPNGLLPIVTQASNYHLQLLTGSAVPGGTGSMNVVKDEAGLIGYRVVTGDRASTKFLMLHMLMQMEILVSAQELGLALDAKQADSLDFDLMYRPAEPIQVPREAFSNSNPSQVLEQLYKAAAMQMSSPGGGIQ